MRTDIVKQLEALLEARGTEIADWFIEEFRATPPNIYSSVDLRHSGFKIVPVDTNLFPAGFNNLSEAARGRAVISFKRGLQQRFPDAQKLLIVPENHTRNLGYLENLRVLQQLLEKAGYQIEIGRVDESVTEAVTLETMSGASLRQQPVKRQGDRLVTASGFAADVVLLNNDLTSGIPAALQGLAQPLLPEPALGWHRRRKSQHFAAYHQVANAFAKKFGIDCWQICTYAEAVSAVDFKERQGMEALRDAVARVLEQTAAKYKEHGITQTPYAYIKADAGTYGMGIMTVTRAEEVLELNKKARNKMDVIKEGAEVHQVLVQEGVPTVDEVAGSPAEPMMYLVGGQTIGGAYRYNPERDPLNNLNAQGMRFTGMCDQDEPENALQVRVENCNFKVFGLIARLATLGAAKE
jgi:glutamate--cysteine ligase